MTRSARRRATCAGLLLAACLAGTAGPALAYKPGRPKLIGLTDTILRKIIVCHRPVTRAEEQATGGMSEVYRRRARLRDAALARCGFPKAIVWRDAVHSAILALDDLRAGDAPDEVRAANRAVAEPFRAQLDLIFAE